MTLFWESTLSIDQLQTCASHVSPQIVKYQQTLSLQPSTCILKTCASSSIEGTFTTLPKLEKAKSLSHQSVRRGKSLLAFQENDAFDNRCRGNPSSWPYIKILALSLSLFHWKANLLHQHISQYGVGLFGSTSTFNQRMQEISLKQDFLYMRWNKKRRSIYRPSSILQTGKWYQLTKCFFRVRNVDLFVPSQLCKMEEWRGWCSLPMFHFWLIPPL